MKDMKNLSLYIHIPFCTSKCYYCDFISFPQKEGKIDNYIDSLIIELGLYVEKLKGYNIKTIFIGGGTPSSIDPRHIYRILEFIYKNYNMANTSEITIETNPGTLDREKVEMYKDGGINRISIGVQTLDDRLLKAIGRLHTSDDFFDSYELIRKAGINNINADLIFGLPGQDLESVLGALKKVTALNIEHISYYGLILEENTKLHKLYKDGKISLPHEDEERRMYHEITGYLIDHGYKHYEISNYALPNYESKHNLVYWDLKPYLGVGLNSHSYMEGRRFYNTSNINNYIESLNRKSLPLEGEQEIDKDTEIEEFCILGLRKIQGIDKEKFKSRFNLEIESLYGDIINKHIDNGLIEMDNNFIYLTKTGLDLSNLVEVDFLR